MAQDSQKNQVFVEQQKNTVVIEDGTRVTVSNPSNAVTVASTGPKGDVGATGATGPTGPTGPQGPQGPGTVTALPVTSDYGWTIYGTATSYTMISTWGVALPAFTPMADGQITQVQVLVTGVAGSTLDIALYACNSVGEPGDKVNDLTTIDCSTTGSKTVSGLTQAVDVGSVYRLVAGPGATPPSVYGRSLATSGLNRTEQMAGPFVISTNPVDNLTRGTVWISTAGLVASPTWQQTRTSAVYPNLKFYMDTV